MPRLARQLADESCYHVLTRGNNRAAIFHEPADYQRYVQLVLEYFAPHGEIRRRSSECQLADAAMPRKPRQLLDGGCYHRIARGNTRMVAID